MSKVDTSKPLVGTSLLQLALYWYVVAQFHAVALGVIVFLVAMLVNATHLLLRSDAKPAAP